MGFIYINGYFLEFCFRQHPFSSIEGDNSYAGLIDFGLSRNLYKYYLIIHLSRQSNSFSNQWSQVFSKYLPMEISGFSPHHSMMTYIDISSMMTYKDIIQDFS